MYMSVEALKQKVWEYVDKESQRLTETVIKGRGQQRQVGRS